MRSMMLRITRFRVTSFLKERARSTEFRSVFRAEAIVTLAVLTRVTRKAEVTRISLSTDFRSRMVCGCVNSTST